MRPTALAKKPQPRIIAQGVPLPAPVGGWDGISPLANMPVDRAVQLDNWVPRPGWIEPRRGYVAQCNDLGSSSTPVQTVMAYNADDANVQLFGVAGGTIYDCSFAGAAVPTNVTSLKSSRLQYVMFANPAGQYLYTVNGEDDPWSYDGTTWAQLPITIGNATGTIVWSTNFLDGETINLNGTIVTFVTGSASGNEVLIGSTLAGSINNLLSFLDASTDGNIAQFTFLQSLGTTLNLIAASTGPDGNALTIAAGFARGGIVFLENPSNGDTITLDGTVVEFVTSGAGANQVNISTSLSNTLQSLLAVLQASTDAGIQEFTYSISGGTTLELVAASAGVLGNALTIGASAAAASGPFLVGGSTAQASGATLSGGGFDYGITPDQFITVNSYASRLWFIPNNSLNAVFLQTVLGVQGSASVFPLGQLFRRGGYLMAIGTWTVDTRQNVDEYIAFISSRGEVAVYAGTDPTTSNTFALVGLYQIGAPIGRRCFVRISGDLQIITVDGVVGMSEMLSTDRAAANRVSLTSIIMNYVAQAAQNYKNNWGWQIIEFAFGTLTILNIPIQENTQQMQFVMNTITGAWSRFIGTDTSGNIDYTYGINANCWEVDGNDNIYFGGNNGTVYKWNVGSGDNGLPITCVVQGAYNSFGNAAQFKRYTQLQPLITTTGNPIPAIGINVDFNTINDLSVEEPIAALTPLWGLVNWGQFNWGSSPTTTNNWLSVEGMGHYVSIVTRVTTTPDIDNPAATTTLQLNGWNILAENGAFI